MPFEPPARLQRLGEDISRGELRYHQKRVTVTREFTFDAAHHLHAYEGKCVGLHGHTYRLRVSVSGVPDELGLTIDFADLKTAVREAVIVPLDHQYLNRALPPMNTTAENLVVWIYEAVGAELAKKRRNDVRMERVELWETPESSVEVSRQEMEG